MVSILLGTQIQRVLLNYGFCTHEFDSAWVLNPCLKASDDLPDKTGSAFTSHPIGVLWHAEVKHNLQNTSEKLWEVS